jgi:hypothetical protein
MQGVIDHLRDDGETGLKMLVLLYVQPRRSNLTEVVYKSSDEEMTTIRALGDINSNSSSYLY